MDIVNHILSYDDRFKIRNGIPLSIIPKDDFRYSILKKITRNRIKNEKVKMFRGKTSYSYECDFCDNLYDIEGRKTEFQRVDNDNLYIEIDITKYKVTYSMIWFRLKPQEKTVDNTIGKYFCVGKMVGYSWDCYGFGYEITNFSPCVTNSRKRIFDYCIKN